MSKLSSCIKGLAAIAAIVASPVFIVFALPFGYGIAGDILNSVMATAIALMAAAGLAALSWTRYRSRDTRLPALSRQSPGISVSG